jgi:hypothetical protein
MAEFNQERAIARYNQLMSLIQSGTYQKRGMDDSYGKDGIEQEADSIALEAAQHGLEFRYHEDTNTYTLELISAKDIY